MKSARGQVQALLGAEHDSEIIFTSCGTESDSTAILSALRAQPERKEIITTVVEHPAVLALCEHLEKEGYKVHHLKVDGKGRLDMREYMGLLSDRVAIVSVMWANNESGTLFPVEEMAELAHSAGVMFHTDAVQAVGKVPIDLQGDRHRHAVAVRAQAPCTQGHRRAVSAPRYAFPPPAAGRSPGARAPGRHREYRLHRRSRHGLRAGPGAHGVPRRPG